MFSAERRIENLATNDLGHVTGTGGVEIDLGTGRRTRSEAGAGIATGIGIESERGAEAETGRKVPVMRRKGDPGSNNF